MISRVAAGCVLLASALAGLLFAPVFGLWALVAPIAVVVVICYAVTEVCARVPGLVPWRPVLCVVAGLVGLVEVELLDTTVAGLPTGATVRALFSGVTESWRLTLQSTWPVRPDAELLLFVPLAVLVAAVAGIELLRRPALAILPSLALLGLSQVFIPWSGAGATLAGLGFVALGGATFMVSRRASRTLLLVTPTLVLAIVAAVVVTVFDQGNQPAYSLHHDQPAPLPQARIVNPLNEVAARLEHPDTAVFSYTSARPVGRWRLVVLDDFNGATWSTDAAYQRLGAGLPAPAGAPATLRSAQVSLPPGDGAPWLPSQEELASVTGVAPLIAPDSGVLLAPERAGAVSYRLNWWEPQTDAGTLANAALDTSAAGGELGTIPPGVTDLARIATAGMRPSFQAALQLERYLSENYRVATGTDLPTGAGWPQLSDFLLSTKRGTSEQFAASYVALARIVGIPARLAVGFRAPQASPDGHVVVRNANVLAWPEVAVAGVGWVPLDPSGAAGGSGEASSGLARITAQARASLPPPQELKDPPLPATGPGSAAGGGGLSIPVLPILLALLALAVLVVVAIPVSKAVRTWRRRRLTGARGIAAACAEARDLLRAHGVPVTAGMTTRDLALAAPVESVVDSLTGLARQADVALWSRSGPDAQAVDAAWRYVRGVRRGLAHRSLGVRVRAVFDVRGLLAPARA